MPKAIELGYIIVLLPDLRISYTHTMKYNYIWHLFPTLTLSCISTCPPFNFMSFYFLDTRYLYVVLLSWSSVYTRMALNTQRSHCLCLLSAGIEVCAIFPLSNSLSSISVVRMCMGMRLPLKHWNPFSSTSSKKRFFSRNYQLPIFSQ